MCRRYFSKGEGKKGIVLGLRERERERGRRKGGEILSVSGSYFSKGEGKRNERLLLWV